MNSVLLAVYSYIHIFMIVFTHCIELHNLTLSLSLSLSLSSLLNDMYYQASELSEIVGKAFKATFAKQTLTRDKKKKGGNSSSGSSSSSTPWSVVNQPQPSTSSSASQSSSHGPSSIPAPSAPPAQRQPWTTHVSQQQHNSNSVYLYVYLCSKLLSK